MNIGNIDRNAIKLIPPLKMPTLIIGEDSIKLIGEEAEKLGGKNALIITDKEMIKFGLTKITEESLQQKKIDFTYFDEVTAEPTIGIVEKAITKARKDQSDIIIGIGGGSVVDATKVVACVVKNNITVREYMEKTKKVNEKRLPFILVPTTSGTGAEVNSGSVIIDEKENAKKSVKNVFADLAIIDSLLTLSLPPKLTAYTGIDALCHAMGCYITRNANPLTEAIAIEAIYLIAKYLRRAVNDGQDREARNAMSIAASIGMIARVNSGGGAVHGMAYPLATKYHVPHGLSIALLMPYVMAYNVESSIKKFIRIAEAMGEKTEGLSEDKAAVRAIESIKSLLTDCGVQLGLRRFGVKKEDFADFAEQVYHFSYRHIERNPRMLSKEEIVKIYEDAF
jgi:alcohol dehydrogenase